MPKKPGYVARAVVLAAMPLLFFPSYGTSGAASTPALAQEGRQPDLPIVDYEKEISTPKDNARREKGGHFRGQANPDWRRPIQKLPDNVETLPTISHWWVGLPALPVDQSDVVILGHIVSREAHLSDDRTGIYSEFEVQVTEIFKDSTRAMAAGVPLTVNRIGGSVRFASGRIQRYAISRQDMPHSDFEYVLFLRRTAHGDLLIITGYELSYGHVRPLDGEDTFDPRSTLPFAKYRGKEAGSFLQEVRDAAAPPVTGP